MRFVTFDLCLNVDFESNTTLSTKRGSTLFEKECYSKGDYYILYVKLLGSYEGIKNQTKLARTKINKQTNKQS